jgi:hypothetical protein
VARQANTVREASFALALTSMSQEGRMSILDIAQVILCEYVAFAEELLRLYVCFAEEVLRLYVCFAEEVLRLYVYFGHCPGNAV